MNERIKELMLKAEHGNYGRIPFAEKFAELIIQECASICELNGESYKHSFTPMKARLTESTSVYCSQLIKKHFGVE